MTLSKRVGGVDAELAGPEYFDVVVPGQEAMPAVDLKELFVFQQQVWKLQRAVSGSLQVANDLKSRLSTIKRALQETTAPVESLITTAFSMDSRLNVILRNLRGDNTMRSRSENSPPSISDRVNAIVDNERTSTAKPTQTDRDAYSIAGTDFEKELQKLKTMVGTELPTLEKTMELKGSPWTPGRMPEWKKD